MNLHLVFLREFQQAICVIPIYYHGVPICIEPEQFFRDSLLYPGAFARIATGNLMAQCTAGGPESTADVRFQPCWLVEDTVG